MDTLSAEFFAWRAAGSPTLTAEELEDDRAWAAELAAEAAAERFWEDRPDLDPGGRYHMEAMADADLYEAQRDEAMGSPDGPAAQQGETECSDSGSFGEARWLSGSAVNVSS